LLLSGDLARSDWCAIPSTGRNLTTRRPGGNIPYPLSAELVSGKEVRVRLLLTGDGGRLCRGDCFKAGWQGAFRAAGVEYRNRADGMHALRHFYASTLLAQGVSIKKRAEYLGHSDPGFTLRTHPPGAGELRAGSAGDRRCVRRRKLAGPTKAPNVAVGSRSLNLDR
jgi:integrase